MSIIPLNRLLQVPSLDLQPGQLKACLPACRWNPYRKLNLLCLSFPSRNERRTSATSWSGWRATTTTPTAPGSTPTCMWRWSGLASTSVGAKLDRVRRPSCFSRCPPCAERGAGSGWEVPRCDGNEDGAVRKSLPPENNCDTFTTDLSWDFILLQPCSASAFSSSGNSGPTVHHPVAIIARWSYLKGTYDIIKGGFVLWLSDRGYSQT